MPPIDPIPQPDESAMDEVAARIKNKLAGDLLKFRVHMLPYLRRNMPYRYEVANAEIEAADELLARGDYRGASERYEAARDAVGKGERRGRPPIFE